MANFSDTVPALTASGDIGDQHSGSSTQPSTNITRRSSTNHLQSDGSRSISMDRKDAESTATTAGGDADGSCMKHADNMNRLGLIEITPILSSKPADEQQHNQLQQSEHPSQTLISDDNRCPVTSLVNQSAIVSLQTPTTEHAPIGTAKQNQNFIHQQSFDQDQQNPVKSPSKQQQQAEPGNFMSELLNSPLFQRNQDSSTSVAPNSAQHPSSDLSSLDKPSKNRHSLHLDSLHGSVKSHHRDLCDALVMSNNPNNPKAHSEAATPTEEECPAPSNEFKTKSIMNLNSINSFEFVEGYRNRNSSQRPLVGEESFSRSSSTSFRTLNDQPSLASDGGGFVGKDGALLMTVGAYKSGGKSPDDGDDDDGNGHNAIDSRSSTQSIPERGQWSGQLDFIFSCISYAVGLGNVWRFPYLCYKNGGGAFLIPYLICVATLGIPLFLMEVGLGQYTQSGGVSIWNKIPIMKGVGFASMVMIGLCNTYYIVIISWTLYYLWSSLKAELPWQSCDNAWNTELCHNVSSGNNNNSQTPSAEFWKLNVLNLSEDLSEIGGIQIHLLITLIVAWILVYIVICRGIHQSGKIIWFTAMFPYVILTILLCYGLSLQGSELGISFYLTPDWNKLSSPDIWVAAGTQLLFTYGIGIGTNIALGSYNRHNHNFFRDSLIACVLSSCTSLFSGFVIFSVLGHLAFKLGVPVESVADEGPGLTFEVYPEALSLLPIPHFWAILFFLMLLILGIDSQFCTVESFVTGLVDEFPRFLRPRRQLFLTFVVVCHLLLGLTMITQGGLYIFQLMDNFSASGPALLVIVLAEVVGFCWIYGGRRIAKHMNEMLGFRIPRFFPFVWIVISPAILLAILVFSIVKYSFPEMKTGVPYPWYGQLIGWIISCSSMVCIPLYFVYFILFKTDSSLTMAERIKSGFSENVSTSSSTCSTSEGGNFESNSNLEESFNCDVEKCSGLDLLNNIHDPNSKHAMAANSPVPV